MYFDSDHVHDQVTRRSVPGVLSFVGSTHISCTSKRRVTIKISSYSAEFCAGQVATKEAIALRYIFRFLGVPVKGTTSLCGYNLGMIIYCTNPDLDIKKKLVAISNHKLGESAAAVIVNSLKVCTTVNQSDIPNKGVLAVTLGSLSDTLYGVD